MPFVLAMGLKAKFNYDNIIISEEPPDILETQLKKVIITTSMSYVFLG